MHGDDGLHDRGRSVRPFILCALVLATCLLAAGGPAQAARGSPAKTRGEPEALWRVFPLGSRKLSPPKPPAPVAATRPAPATIGVLRPPEQPGGGLFDPLWYALAVLAVAGAAALVTYRSARGTLPARVGTAPRGSAGVAARIASHLRTGEASVAKPVVSARFVEVLPAEEGPPEARVHLPAVSVPADFENLAEQPEVGAGHVLLAPTASGYQIVPRRGDAPVPGAVLAGDEVGLDGHFSVASVGPSPIAGDARDCAYLIRVD